MRCLRIGVPWPHGLRAVSFARVVESARVAMLEVRGSERTLDMLTSPMTGWCE